MRPGAPEQTLVLNNQPNEYHGLNTSTPDQDIRLLDLRRGFPQPGMETPVISRPGANSPQQRVEPGFFLEEFNSH